MQTLQADYFAAHCNLNRSRDDKVCWLPSSIAMTAIHHERASIHRVCTCRLQK
jgi:hypothetical protein